MQILTIIGIAIALAMDAFAVAIATGVNLKKVSIRQTFRLSWHFGLFQALMPILGWSLGSVIQANVEAYAHWISSGLLALIGCNMIREALIIDEQMGKSPKDATRGFTMVMLSIATSLDALAVGISLSMLEVSIITPAIIIGIVAGLFTILGLHIGKKVANLSWISRWAETIGGLVLLGIAVKIVLNSGILSS